MRIEFAVADLRARLHQVAERGIRGPPLPVRGDELANPDSHERDHHRRPNNRHNHQRPQNQPIDR